MGGRNLDVDWLVGVAGLVALACSGRSIDHERNGGGNAARAGDSGAQGGAAGQGGSGGASTGGSNGCEAGTARCNADGIRETCTQQATWSVTDFVCARNVAVDDQLGTYCVTKSDGTYRCWGAEALGELPPERYVRVQLTGYGDRDFGDTGVLPVVGLTDDGRLLAVGLDLPSDTSPAVAFRATNMGGYTTVCPLFTDGTFSALYNPPDVSFPEFEPVRPFEGRFSRAFCVWEGLAIGIRTDGTLWSNGSVEVMPGNDWVEVAHSVGILCGIKTTRELVCGQSFLCRTSSVDCLGFTPPVFPPGRYLAIAATRASACALDDQGALLCKRFDGADMPIEPGPYTFVEGGRDVVCALRVDGSSACFSHGGEGFSTDVGPFVPIEPAIDQSW